MDSQLSLSTQLYGECFDCQWSPPPPPSGVVDAEEVVGGPEMVVEVVVWVPLPEVGHPQSASFFITTITSPSSSPPTSGGSPSTEAALNVFVSLAGPRLRKILCNQNFRHFLLALDSGSFPLQYSFLSSVRFECNVVFCTLWLIRSMII